jgi:hypothetical protein
MELEKAKEIIRTRSDWEKCDNCGGDVPPQSLWGREGEKPDGYCPGHVHADGICGAFATSGAYERYLAMYIH